MYKDHNYTAQDAEEYVSNPINTFALIKRTAYMWPNLKHALFNQSEAKLDEMISLLEKYDISEEDLEGAMKGLVLLLSTYRFNITEFVNGKIRVPEAQAIGKNPFFIA